MQKIQDSTSQRYLFFISQNYSFPVLRPLQEEIRRRGGEVYWFLYGDEIDYNLLHNNESRLHTIQDIKQYNPHAVFVPGNVVPSFIPGLKVQVFHGLPSQKRRKNGQLYHYIIRGMFDLYCTQGPSSTTKFNTLQEQYQFFSVVETGWSKLDPLFQIDHTNEPDREKTILFASTFSPRFSKAALLYPYIRKMIQTHPYHWYITFHPKMSQDIVALYHTIQEPNVTFIETTHIVEKMKECDVMLCDTSSIMYEFLMQEKPVIAFQTEKEEPFFINQNNIETLEETLIDTLQNPTKYNKEIKNAIQEIHPYTDGKSSKRVLDAVDNHIAHTIHPKKSKPLNIVRNFQLRKALGYWYL